MMGQRRRFSQEEKLAILREAGLSKITEVLHKYNLSYSVFHRWRRQFAPGTEYKPKAAARKEDPKIKSLTEENELLKKIIESQAVLLGLKAEQQKRNSS
jgi:putative transposase